METKVGQFIFVRKNTPITFGQMYKFQAYFYKRKIQNKADGWF